MRILVGHSRYRQTGGEDSYVEQLVELLSTEHQVETFLRHNTDATMSMGTAVNMLGSPRTMREARAAIADFRPDIVHIHNVYPMIGPALHLAARRAEIPIVMTVHNYRLRCPNGLMYTEGALCRRCESGNHGHALRHDCFPTGPQAAAYASILAAHRFMLPLENMVDAFVAPSAFVAQRLREWGLPPRRIHELPHPISGTVATTTELGSAGLFLGRIRAEKGPQTIVAALAAAGDPSFVFAGAGPLQAELEERVRRAGLHNTEFVGWQPKEQVAHLLKAARFVVMPSRFEEPAGLAALEAMAAGRPLLVSDRGGLPEVADLGAALCVGADDVAAMAGAIRRLMTDDELANRLAAAGRAAAAGRYSKQAHTRGLNEIYQSVL